MNYAVQRTGVVGDAAPEGSVLYVILAHIVVDKGWSGTGYREHQFAAYVVLVSGDDVIETAHVNEMQLYHKKGNVPAPMPAGLMESPMPRDRAERPGLPMSDSGYMLYVVLERALSDLIVGIASPETTSDPEG